MCRNALREAKDNNPALEHAMRPLELLYITFNLPKITRDQTRVREAFGESHTPIHFLTNGPTKGNHCRRLAHDPPITYNRTRQHRFEDPEPEPENRTELSERRRTTEDPSVEWLGCSSGDLTFSQRFRSDGAPIVI